jgi:hypothetical protein
VKTLAQRIIFFIETSSGFLDTFSGRLFMEFLSILINLSLTGFLIGFTGHLLDSNEGMNFRG